MNSIFHNLPNMITLDSFWNDVPNMTDAELKQYACSFPTQETANLLLGQDEMTPRNFRIAVRPMADGKFYLNCDVLREMHPAVTSTNLYGPEYGPLIEQLGPTVEVIPIETAVAQLPTPPNTQSGDFDFENPPEWVQPNSTNPYSYGSIVSYNGKTYRCVDNFNVWSPEPYPNGYGWVEYPAPPAPTGPMAWVQPIAGVPGKEPYNTGNVVFHPNEDTLWESLVDSNVWEPSASVATLWKPNAVWTPPNNTAKPWQQPTPGVSPPYEVNDSVTHNGHLWTCNFPQCVWEPGVYGWFDEGVEV